MSVWELSARIYVVLSLVCVSLGGCAELRVRVRLTDGLIAEETLFADSVEDAITVEFKQGDGTHITVLFDFKRDVRIFRALVLGEPERGQNQYQVLCFITRLDHHEIIPSESMARLRQKNPHLVRSAEEARGVERLRMDAVLNASRAGQLNAHLHNMCRQAGEGVYTRTADIRHWLEKGVEPLESSPLEPRAPAAPAVQRCPASQDPWQPCVCSYRLRLEWVPCLLKYCRSRRGAAAKANPYKCGIRSCSKGYRFDYYVPHRLLCPWDEES